MDFSASHIGFVIASYALTFVCLAALVLSILMKDRRLRAEVLRLDTQRKGLRP
jgi:heme exporter protein CcmD